jgi:hypothetical protein
MYINAIITKKEKERRKKEKACYKYGKKNYFAKQYRQGLNYRMANWNLINKIVIIMEKPQTPEDSGMEVSNSQEELLTDERY